MVSRMISPFNDMVRCAWPLPDAFFTSSQLQHKVTANEHISLSLELAIGPPSIILQMSDLDIQERAPPVLTMKLKS
jgi:hypothetical protein